MARLEDLIILCQDSPDMLLNIELKGPLDFENWGNQYDYDMAVHKML